MGWLRRREPSPRSIDTGWLIAGLAVAILAVLALPTISTKSFWYDEAFSLGVVRRPLADMIATFVSREANGSAFHLALSAWQAVGDSEARIRSLSVLFTAATIPLLYVLGRRHVGTTAAALACVLFAINPLVIEYAQEARMYAMALFASTALVLAWSFATDGDRVRWWVVYAVTAVVAVYTHFFCGFVVLGLGLIWLVGLVPRTWSGFAGQVAICAACAPLAIFIALSGFEQINWILPITESGVSLILGAFGGGSLVLSLLLAGGAIAALATREPERLRRLAPLVAWWLTPLVLGLAISIAQSLLERRYYIVALPPFLLLASAGFVRVGMALAGIRGRRSAAIVGVVLVAILVAGPLAAWYEEPRWDWRGAADWVARTAEPGDRIVYVEQSGRIPFELYLERYTDRPPRDVTPDEVRATSGRTWLVLYLLRRTGFTGAEATFPGYRVVDSKFFQGARVQLLERTE